MEKDATTGYIWASWAIVVARPPRYQPLSPPKYTKDGCLTIAVWSHRIAHYSTVLELGRDVGVPPPRYSKLATNFRKSGRYFSWADSSAIRTMM